MTTLNIHLPDETLAVIDSLVGTEGRASFIADATDAEVRRQQMLAFLRSDVVVMRDEDHPEFNEGSAEWVRKLRAGV